MPTCCRICLIALLMLLGMPSAWAEDGEAPGGGKPAGLVPFARGGYLHQFEADIHDGSRYSVNRAAFQAGPAWLGGGEKLVALAPGYRYDGYTFSGNGLFGQRPWNEVHTFDLSLPIKWPVTRRWTAFCIPTIRSSAESGASFEDSITGGGLVGAWWKCSKKLKIGPGVGVQTQLEDDPIVFPVLLIDWKIRKNWSLETGAGLGATQGPGLVLKYKPTEHWEFALGGRYDKLRFRMDNKGIAPGGVGEDTAFGVLVSARYWFGPMNLAYVGAAAGADFAGDLAIEDRRGRRLATETHDAAFTLGVFLGIGF